MRRRFKNIIIVLLSLGMLSGCGKEVQLNKGQMQEGLTFDGEEGEEKSGKETKYSRLNKDLSEELMLKMGEEEFSEFQPYFECEYTGDLVCRIENDKEVIEKELMREYGTWYLDGTDEALVYDENVLMGKEYGVRYAFWRETKSLSQPDLYIVLYYLDEPEKIISKFIESNYVYLSYDDVFIYTALYLDNEQYNDCSNREIELAELAESQYYSQYDSLLPTSTPQVVEEVEEKPDVTDMYCLAMENIDDAISKSNLTKKYSGYSYKIKDKKIDEHNDIFGTSYTVSFLIEIEGVFQKYRVDVDIIPGKDIFFGGFNYHVHDTDVSVSGSLSH